MTRYQSLVHVVLYNSISITKPFADDNTNINVNITSTTTNTNNDNNNNNDDNTNNVSISVEAFGLRGSVTPQHVRVAS